MRMSIPSITLSFPYRIALAVALFLAPLMLSTTRSFAQDPCGGHGSKGSTTNTGTEFLLVYDENELPEYTDGSYQDIFLATLDQPAKITVTCKHYTTYSRVFNLAANSSMTYHLSVDLDPLMNSSEVVDNTVVHVVSDNSIACYGMNHKTYTTDAFLALPRNTATTDYRVMSYANSALMSVGNQRQSEFSVAAFSDNTNVTITPSARTLSGKPAGAPITFTLNAGDGVQIQADPNTALLDLTGSHVTSDQPVVVFGAHVRAEVPVGYQQQNGTTSRDHLSEEIPPTSTWGQGFICTSFSPRATGDLLRIQALNDNTSVKFDGKLVATLAHDKWFDSLITGPVAVETSGPALAGMFAHTATTNQGQGDPFLAIAPPVNQSYTDYTFFTSQDSSYTENDVVVVTEQSGAGKITMDGNVIPAASYTPLTTPLPFQITPPISHNYAVATVHASPGAHHISTTNDAEHGFTILAYGFGRVDSYGYTAGALLKPLRGVHMSTGDNPGVTPGAKVQNVVDVRNILAARVYLDSCIVTLDGDAGKYYTAKVRENFGFDNGHLEMGEHELIHIDINPPLVNAMMGTVKFYTHSALWNDFETSDARIRLQPVQTATVAATATEAGGFSSSYPNPFSSFTTISFTLPKHGDLSLKVYDDLGRLVTTLIDQQVASGPYNVRFEQPGLPAGHYLYELKSESLNINERHSIVLSK